MPKREELEEVYASWFCGIPNVGKSSFINRMAKKSSAIVGNKPGVTKQKQWIRMENSMELMDTPGVLWPKLDSKQVALNLAFTGTIKQEILDEAEVAFYLLKYLLEHEKGKIFSRYQFSENEWKIVKSQKQEADAIMDMMYLIGKKRGAIIAGGKIDESKVAKMILEDFQNGRIGRITLEKIEKQEEV